MARQGGVQSRGTARISGLSKGFSVRNETANIKRTLFLKPAAHSSRNSITWASSVYILMSIVILAILINTQTSIIYQSINTRELVLLLCLPDALSAFFMCCLILIMSYVYMKVFEISMSKASYVMILSFSVGIPILILDSIAYLLLKRHLEAVYNLMAGMLPFIIIGILSQYIASINLADSVAPTEDGRTNILRQLTIVIGNFICAVLFYLTLLYFRENMILFNR
ncbi:hypothetical protein NEIRO03_0839 [Nematocida sp. AWRm78]|nr:hypothetical protein NEIRO02_0747 [Nematocida sp. AWRm79]KAI5183221.1 hypothetical protein NEIRO03_0839 [Nematocida sp. AWRm78]